MFASGLLNENPLQNYLILNTIWNVCPNAHNGTGQQPEMAHHVLMIRESLDINREPEKSYM